MKLYHISPISRLTVLIPTRPKNKLVDLGIEEGVTKRVSLSPTLMGCVRGVSDNEIGAIYYVYEALGLNPKYIVHPTTRMVPDVNHTHEVWYTKPVNVKKIGAIMLLGSTHFKYVDIDTEKHGKIGFPMNYFKYKKIRNPGEDNYKFTTYGKIRNFVGTKMANHYSKNMDSSSRLCDKDEPGVIRLKKSKIKLEKKQEYSEKNGQIIMYNIMHGGQLLGRLREVHGNLLGNKEGQIRVFIQLLPKYECKELYDFVLKLHHGKGYKVVSKARKI